MTLKEKFNRERDKVRQRGNENELIREKERSRDRERERKRERELEDLKNTIFHFYELTRKIYFYSIHPHC